MTRIYKTSFASIGDKEDLADTDPGTGKVSLPTGWTADYEKEDTDPNYRPVGRREMNGVFNEITSSLGEVQLLGFATWRDLAGGWPLNAQVSHNGLTYRSTAQANMTEPGEAGAAWVKMSTGIASQAETSAGESATLTVTPATLKVVIKEASRVYSILSIPTKDIGPITIAECGEIWIWVQTPYYTGYRSPLCGRPMDGHTVTPLPSEVDAVGGLLPKSEYVRLWGYAQENGLVVSQATWTANIGAHLFVDASSTQFRVPDLRNMFRRFSGTDADTANARTLGSRQNDASQLIWGGVWAAGIATKASLFTSGAFYPADQYVQNDALPGSGTWERQGFGIDTARVARTSNETRSINVAYHPRIHV